MAKIIGLLHDVGRFEQYIQYRTFIDSRSIDHGKHGAKIVKHNELILDLDSSSQNIIQSAITYHNKATIPLQLEENQLLHTKMIRDADKLDILHIMTKKIKDQIPLYALHQNQEIDKIISENVIVAIIKKEIVNYDDLRNELDHYLMKIGWVYDLNFIPTFQLLIKRNYLAAIRTTLPINDTINWIFYQVNDYINQELICAQSREYFLNKQKEPLCVSFRKI